MAKCDVELAKCRGLEEGGVCCPDENPEPEYDCIDLLKRPGSGACHSVHMWKTQAYNEGIKNCGVMCLTLFALLMCVISFFVCQECLFALLIVSACLCPFFHPMNAPLWLAIVLLTIGGWNFTVGALTVTWNYKSHPS
jgi:hypothetical protein